MRKYIILVFTIICYLTQSLWAQQQSLYSQYMLNGIVINPAITGTSDLTPIQLSVRQQWVGIDAAPQTQVLSGHTKMGRNDVTGLGGMVFRDAFGPISKTGLTGAFSYKIQAFNTSMLSFGLSFSVFQFSFNNTDLNIIDDSDVAFSGSSETSIVPDANFGLYLYNDHYFVSLSSTQLLQLPINLDSDVEINKHIRHYYLYGGYKFKLNDAFKIEPSAMIKVTEETPLQVDLNTRVYYNNNYWLGFSYRHLDALIAMIGVKYDRYTLAYAYDYSLSHLTNYNSGSHEILIRFDLSKKQTSSALL